jgi:phage baseplate assembly protein W
MSLAFNWETGEFVLDAANGALVCDEAQTIRQWVLVALSTPAGESLIYPDYFGSRLLEDGREGVADDDVAGYLEAALLVHDRISAVEGVTVARDPVDDERVIVGFTVVVDTGLRIVFEEVQVA